MVANKIQFEIQLPNEPAYRLEVENTSSVLGRSHHNDVVIPDPRVSKIHAELIQKANGRYYVLDLDSRNGLFLNGERVEKAEIGVGDRLRIGNTMIFLLASASEAEEPEEPFSGETTGVEFELPALQLLENGESIGEAIGSMAHELNNPLTTILGYIDLLLMEETPDVSWLDTLQVVQEEGQRVRELVDRLRSFSHELRSRESAVKVGLQKQDTLSPATLP